MKVDEIHVDGHAGDHPLIDVNVLGVHILNDLSTSQGGLRSGKDESRCAKKSSQTGVEYIHGDVLL